MKRRTFGLLGGTSLLALSTGRAFAQQTAPDPKLLSSTLTPLGAERAGNADGSIPAWTGGMVDPTAAVDILVFTDEQPLLVIDANNASQYQDLLNAGTMAMISGAGFSLHVYPTHRTAAAPQYVYDNTVLNVTRAQLNPQGGRLGFTGAYGGPPFPIINTSDPLVGGAQLIWNHLTTWGGFCSAVGFTATYVGSNGVVLLSEGNRNKFRYPYYDPNGSLETFGTLQMFRKILTLPGAC
jgi:hypothetical protein